MKRWIIFAFVLSVLLVGCTPMQTNTQTSTQADTREESIDTGHRDHHAAQTRKARNFFFEIDDGELPIRYLSYNEPDGCVTRLCEVSKAARLEPKLIQQGNAFYYLLYEESYGEEYGKVISDGYLYRIDFSGDKTHLQAPDGFALGHIIRVDESYIYCTANEGENYLRADLEFTGWEEITKEAVKGKKILRKFYKKICFVAK